MTGVLSIGEITAILLVAITFLYTMGTFLLWKETKKAVELSQKTVSILLQQLRHQAALNQSSAQHQIIDAHRDLFSAILLNPDFAEIYARENSKSKESLQTEMLATFLINHCLTIFVDHNHGIIDKSQMDSFIRDARGLFSLGFIRARWATVRSLHPQPFQFFVESHLLENPDP